MSEVADATRCYRLKEGVPIPRTEGEKLTLPEWGDTESSVGFDGKKIDIPGLADIDTAANSHSALDLLRV